MWETANLRALAPSVPYVASVGIARRSPSAMKELSIEPG
jgi:hypothetical protein